MHTFMMCLLTVVAKAWQPSMAHCAWTAVSPLCHWSACCAAPTAWQGWAAVLGPPAPLGCRQRVRPASSPKGNLDLGLPCLRLPSAISLPSTHLQLRTTSLVQEAPPLAGRSPGRTVVVQPQNHRALQPRRWGLPPTIAAWGRGTYSPPTSFALAQAPQLISSSGHRLSFQLPAEQAWFLQGAPSAQQQRLWFLRRQAWAHPPAPPWKEQPKVPA